MSDIDNQIKSRIEGFVTELSTLVRRAALHAVESALKGETRPAPRRGPGRPPAAPAPAAAPAAKGGRRASRRRAGEKRSPQELKQITDRVGDHIKSNPGQGIENIAKQLGTNTKELTLPIRKLLSDKKISSKGQKRATRYFPR